MSKQCNAIFFFENNDPRITGNFSLSSKTLPTHLGELCKSYFGDPPYVWIDKQPHPCKPGLSMDTQLL